MRCHHKRRSHCLLEIMLVMGMVRLPALAHYWKRDPLVQCTIISKSMACDRFEIHIYLHFVDNSTILFPADENYDRLKKGKEDPYHD